MAEWVINDGKLLKYIGEDEVVVVPDGVEIINAGAFAKAPKMKVLIFPDTVKKINGNIKQKGFDISLFLDPLETVHLGNGIKTIGRRAFESFHSLCNVEFGENIEIIQLEAFKGCLSLGTIDLRKTKIKVIEEDAFLYCNSYEILFPETITGIGCNAFNGNSLKKFVIPASVKRIGGGAFVGCDELCFYDDSPIIRPDLLLDDTQIDYSAYYYREYYVSCISAETGKILYRVFCSKDEKVAYHRMIQNAWRKDGTFDFKLYDRFFLELHSKDTMLKTAKCRLEYPYDLAPKYENLYKTYIECAEEEENAIL